MNRSFVPLAATLLFLTGGSALVYELAWARWLSLTLGASAPGLAVTVASTMLGFAAGAGLLGPRIDASRRPLRVYGLLEVAVAFSAVVVSLVLRDATTAAWSVAIPEAVLIALVLVLVGVPTAFMGATLPAVVAFVGRKDAAETRGALGVLYAANTAGAVAGTVIMGFVLVEWIGLSRAAALGICVNGAVGAAALWLDARLGGSAPDALAPAPEPHAADPAAADSAAAPVTSADASGTDSAPRDSARAAGAVAAASDGPSLPAAHALLAAGVSGFGVMAHEVLSTRFLVYGFYATAHAIAIILGVYLAGLSLAAALVARPIRRGEALPWHLGAALVAAGVVALAFTPSLSHAAALVDVLHGSSVDWSVRMLVEVATAAMLLLPPVLAMGTVFPLAMAMGTDARTAGTSVGRAVLVNTLAGAAGSLGAAFVLMPAVGSRGAVAIVSLVQVAAGAWLVWRHAPPTRRALGWAALAGTTLVAIYVAWPVALGSQPGEGTPIPQHLIGRESEYRIRCHREGPTATTEVHEHLETGHRHVIIDGFVAAGQGTNFGYMWLMGTFPMWLHPHPERALVICFGTGSTARAVAFGSDVALDIVDINPDVIACAETANPDNAALLERASVHVEDGRAFLRRSETTYDVITQEPMPPHFAGVSALYSVQYYRSARARLSDDGIMVQWLPMHLTAPEDARAIAAAALRVFPETWMVITPKDYTGLLVMSPTPIPEERRRDVADRLFTEFALDPAGVRRFVDGAAPLTDDHPTVEYNGVDRVLGEYGSSDELLRFNLGRVFEASRPTSP